MDAIDDEDDFESPIPGEAGGAPGEDSADTLPAAEPPSPNLPIAMARAGFALPEEVTRVIDAYCRLLWEWNAKLNLTRHSDYDKFVCRDLWDARHLAPLARAGETVLDVGAGGGALGVLLALLRPDLRVELCDCVQKKAAAVTDIVNRLGLAIPVHARRAEELLAQRHFDVLAARAVGPLDKILRWFEPHWGAFDRLLLVKGPKWLEERGKARHYGLLKQLELRKAAEYTMPRGEAKSVILKIWPKGREEK